MTQLNLFEWANARPTAQVINWLPYLAKRMWAERHKPNAQHQATVTTLPKPSRRERKIA